MGLRDIILALHVAAGAAGLALGPLAWWTERHAPRRSRPGVAYHWAVLAVSLTAIALAALNWSALWWLVPLAVVSYALALLGLLFSCRRASGSDRMYAHGQGGSYIALLTALSVVSVHGPWEVAAWVLPTLVGLPLIERRARSLAAGPLHAARPGPAQAGNVCGRC